MLTTQERLNEVFTSGNLRTNDLMEFTNSVYPSVSRIVKSTDGNRIFDGFPQFYKSINMLVDLIDINPSKAKETMLMIFESLKIDVGTKEALSKSNSEKEILEFIDSIATDPQGSKELLMAVAVGLDLAFEKVLRENE